MGPTTPVDGFPLGLTHNILGNGDSGRANRGCRLFQRFGGVSSYNARLQPHKATLVRLVSQVSPPQPASIPADEV